MISTGPVQSGSTTIADGSDVAEGTTTDAAVVTDANGTLSGKLRGLVKWAFERMPAALGQTTMAASLPVALASNQSNLPVNTAQVNAGTVVTSATGVQKVGVGSGATGNSFVEAIAANVAASPVVGAQLVARPGEWGVQDHPAVNTQATISKAAGGAAVRHVCTSITAVLAGGATASTAAAPPTVILYDGAGGGVGTQVWKSYINIPAVAGECRVITLGGINLVGSLNTAMTLEFTATGGANTYESVSMTGYDV